jgi:hypothetical protein
MRPENFLLKSAGRKKTDPFFPAEIESALRRNFPRFQWISSSHHPNLEHSLSGKFHRIQFFSGRKKCGALFPRDDSPLSCEGILSQTIIWCDYLQKLKSSPPEILYLLLPDGKEIVTQSRFHWIRGAGNRIQMARVNLRKNRLELLDPADSGNLDTHLTQIHRHLQPKDFKQDALLKEASGIAPQKIDLRRMDSSGRISLQVHGLEFAQWSPGPPPCLKYGVPCDRIVSSREEWLRMTQLVEVILREREAPSPSRQGSFFRLQGERWLESLVLRDIRQIDPLLNPDFVYPQVPMFLGRDRGIIDILSVTQKRQLAVLELKIHEEIELPYQGLDYWLRVRWHQARDEFQKNGYFSGLPLAPLPPLLYFVCPQFDYHSTFPLLLRQISASVPWVQIGLNEDWRSGLQVVFRRTS